MPTRLSMHGVSLRFGETPVLCGVDLEVGPGEVHALLGENGAGKTTLMQVLAGVHRLDRGAMALDGEPFAPTGPREAALAGIRMIHQELSLLDHLTVAENVMLGAEPRIGRWFVDRRRRDAAVRDALRLLGHAGLSLRARAGSLPPAMRQLVEIARALAQRARVLVMDEPTSSLGGDDVERLFAVVEELRARGIAVVYISHFLAEVRRVASRATVLRDGRTVLQTALPSCSDDHLVAAMAGRPLGELFPPRRGGPGEVLLRVEGLAGPSLPRRADLSLRGGEILGIGGLCGAGRSELLLTLFGLLPRQRGDVHWFAAGAPDTIAGRWRAGIGLLAEDRKLQGLSLSRSIAENIALPRADRLRRRLLLSRAAMRRAAATWIERLSIRCRDPEQKVAELSGGNQQKVALARLLQAGCRVMLLDEPTRGIDVQSRRQIYRVLRDLATGGTGLLIVSSQLEELLGLCDRIAVQRAGVLGPARPASACTPESLLREALAAPAGP